MFIYNDFLTHHIYNNKRLTMKKIIHVIITASLLISATSVINAKEIDLKKFKTKEALCNYIEQQKDNSESAMKQSYKASQYNKLEQNRKYWKGLYVDKCF